MLVWHIFFFPWLRRRSLSWQWWSKSNSCFTGIIFQSSGFLCCNHLGWVPKLNSKKKKKEQKRTRSGMLSSNVQLSLLKIQTPQICLLIFGSTAFRHWTSNHRCQCLKTHKPWLSWVHPPNGNLWCWWLKFNWVATKPYQNIPEPSKI